LKSMFDVAWKTKYFLLLALLLQSTFDATMLFDIPFAKQVIGFFYLTFVPGLIIVKLLKLDELDIFEIALFSAGFSIAFLMIAGLSINELFLLSGFSQPLSVVPLMIVLNSFAFVGGVLVYLKNEQVKIWRSEPIKMSPFALLFLFLPILSIVGAMYVNAYQNNSLLLFMIIAISLLFAFGVMSKKLLSSKFYPLAVLMIAIALLYHASLISNYIVPFGSDVSTEYFLFKNTQDSAYWSSTLPSLFGTEYANMNAMLSVTILPTIYSTLLKIDSTWTFKLLFPLIFALVPLGLYQFWQTYVGKKYAFFSAFLFMAFETFYSEMFGLNRQMIAELFFVILLLIIMNGRMKPVNKMICFMIFSFALVVSHYALAELFLFFISITLVSLIVLKRPNRKITVGMVVFFFVVMFTWYIYTSGSANFNSFVDFANHVKGQLGDFFNPTSRGQTVMTGLGVVESPSIWNTISRIFAYLTEALIVVGTIGLITKRGRIRIKTEYFILSLTAITFLAMLLLIPGLANAFNMTRFYHVLLFFLAPLCVMGAEFVVRLFSKRERIFAVLALSLIVLVPYFLFQTEFVFEVTGSDSWSIPLSGYRMSALRLYGHYGYTDAYSVFGAKWLSINVNVKNSELYTDDKPDVLIMYGFIYPGYFNRLSNTTVMANNSVVYLDTLNVVAAVVPSRGLLWNTSELSSVFNDLNVIYANGDSEIYSGSP
jgi:uncharacterized membrane protein